MGSWFINAGLAAGIGLAALPVILHLFMRQTPRHVVFPALRLIRERQKKSRKRLRVKNWLLLLARMALLALMALALARPTFLARTKLGDREVPTALALVFDTSLSMSYEERDKTRLDEAREQAIELLGRTHEASRVFVFDSSDPIEPPELKPPAARKRVEALAIRPVNRPLNAALTQAYKALEGAKEPRREVYVFTDLARSSWEPGQPIERPKEPGRPDAPKPPDAKAKAVAGAKAKAPDLDGSDVATYVVRLLPKDPRDVAIVEAEPLSGFTAVGDAATIQVTLRSTGPATRRVVEFDVDGTKRAQKEAALPANGEAILRFETPRLTTPGLHQIKLSLAGEPDPLDTHDTRYLSLDVQPALRVLVVSDLPIDGNFVEYALDPIEMRNAGGRPYPVDRAKPADLEGNTPQPLDEYAAVFLLNVRTLPPSAWGRLNEYVRRGGGVVIGAGDRMDVASWNESGGQLLPATLLDVRNPAASDFTFGKADVNHPLIRRDARNLLTELTRVPIDRYLGAKPVQGARTVLSYGDNEPALIERTFPGPKTGHVLLWTTALSRRPANTEADRRAAWTEFPNPLVGWSFFALMNDSVPYLAGAVGRRLTYDAGEDVSLPIDPSRRFNSYQVQGPGAKSAARLGEPVSGRGLLIPAPPTIGHWKVTASGPDGPPREMGFSINPPRTESQMTPLDEPDLVTLFGGKDRYALADDPEKVEKLVRETRHGRELFPWLMALILALVTAENVLANTFYREKNAARQAAAPEAATSSA